MATRSRIGVLNPDGTITSIYCHFDGYLSGVGEVLNKHYNDPAKVAALIELGDISVLRMLVAPPDGVSHSYGYPRPDTTIAYHRDRDEPRKSTCAVTHPQDNWPDSGAEYLYLFNPPSRSWKVSRDARVWRTIEYATELQNKEG